MSALSRYFKPEGWEVAGDDRTPSPLTAALEREGIAVHYEDSVESIPQSFRDPAVTRVIYTPAIPHDHSELNWFLDHGFEVLKRSRMLGLLGEGKRVMAVAGTHGKTTTTTMTAHFNAVGAGEGSAFLGGISKNFDSNLVLGPGARMAVEADEFDRSFLQLHPQEAVITSVDPDHLDIYGTYEAVREAFAQFASQIVPGGTLILKAGVDLPLERSDIRRYTDHVSDPTADFHAEKLTVDAGGYYTFDLVFPDRRLEGCRLGIPGLVNVENCVAAAALVWCEGFDDARLREAGSSPLTEGVSALELLRRPEVDWKLAAELTDSALDPELGEKIANELKYEGYIARQQKQVEKFRRMELLKIPASIDYAQIRGLSAEGRGKLSKISPATLGQASRIPGVPPSDIQLLWVAIESARRKKDE